MSQELVEATLPGEIVEFDVDIGNGADGLGEPV
jgi:hypothetical protein